MEGSQLPDNFDVFEAEVRESLDKHGFDGLQRGIALLRLLLGEWRSQNLSKERLLSEALKLWEARSTGGRDLYGKRG